MRDSRWRQWGVVEKDLPGGLESHTPSALPQILTGTMEGTTFGGLTWSNWVTPRYFQL